MNQRVGVNYKKISQMNEDVLQCGPRMHYTENMKASHLCPAGFSICNIPAINQR